VGGVIVTADSPGDPERRCQRAGVVVCFVVWWWCSFRYGEHFVPDGRSRFLFFSFLCSALRAS